MKLIEFRKVQKMKTSSWWKLSTVVSISLLAVLITMWVEMHEYEISPNQLANEQAAYDFLYDNWESLDNSSGDGYVPLIKVPTGIFVQSLQFSGASQVHVTGYIWQRYTKGIHDAIKPAPGEVGFILPERMDSTDSKEIYRIDYGDEELIGWYFDATLRQQFDYVDYPFDHKTVWVRLWARDFSQNIALVPDFSSYDSTGVSDIFGIEDEIVLGTWRRENTFFDYHFSSYDTNFGIRDYTGQDGFPEFQYNLVIKREYGNAFIVYLLPLFLVSVLLFAALMTVSEKDNLSKRHGFNTLDFIGGNSALFFVIMIAHIQLRGEVGGRDAVYIEYFYLLMYGMLVATTASTYLFSIHTISWLKFINYKDNIIPKVAYWPTLLCSLIIVTAWRLSLR
jgi:hypothetical protein